MSNNPSTCSHYPLDPYNGVIKSLQDCLCTCENTITMLACKPCEHGKSRAEQIQPLRDCVDICCITAKFIARCSMFARTMANLCAHICEACGHHLSRHHDKELQHCGNVCLNCARECRAYAGMYPEHGYPYNPNQAPGTYNNPYNNP